jgi:hypothetical protein
MKFLIDDYEGSPFWAEASKYTRREREQALLWAYMSRRAADPVLGGIHPGDAEGDWVVAITTLRTVVVNQNPKLTYEQAALHEKGLRAWAEKTLPKCRIIVPALHPLPPAPSRAWRLGVQGVVCTLCSAVGALIVHYFVG